MQPPGGGPPGDRPPGSRGQPPAPQGYPQPGQPAPQGYPQPGQPQPGYPYPNQNPNPYPNQNPYPYPNQNPNGYARAPAPYPAGHSFIAFLKLSLSRAFHLRIEPDEVTPFERVQLERAGITEPSFQAFLAWRRSLLFAFATLVLPLMGLKAYELFSESNSDPSTAKVEETWRGLQTIPLVAEVAFALLAWSQLRRWTQWRRQRRMLMWGWIGFFLASFIVYLYPLRSLLADVAPGNDAVSHKVNESARLVIGLYASVQAMIHLAPKALSLIAGMVRGSIVTKMQFPGSAAPGWLIVLGAPIYSLFVYVVLIIPYQITGNGYFVGAIVAIVIAEALLGRGGYLLARPLTRAQAVATVTRARRFYLSAVLIGAVCIVLALVDLIDLLNLRWVTVVNLIGTFLTNVWILTIITTDLLIDSLDRARGLSAGTSQLADDVNHQLGAFVGVRTVAPGLQPNPMAQPRPR